MSFSTSESRSSNLIFLLGLSKGTIVGAQPSNFLTFCNSLHERVLNMYEHGTSNPPGEDQLSMYLLGPVTWQVRVPFLLMKK